jgi:pimeloyl-ACP methyl ester carboxylesterase
MSNPSSSSKVSRASVVLAAVIAAGSGPALGAQAPGAAATAPVAPVPLAMTPCTLGDSINAECGTLQVPERRDVAGSRLITIPVLRVRARTATSQPPIFWLSGGPGATNARREPPAFLRDSHDWVLVGYRGVDGSTQLECPEISRALGGRHGDLLGERTRRATSLAMRTCADRLMASGVDLRGYTIEEVVGDVDAARTALQYERVHLFSSSYGTRIAQRIAERMPARVARSVLQAANPPGRFAWDAAQLDTVLYAWSRLCADDERCRRTTPDLAAAVRRVAHNMPRRWGPFTIDRGVVLTAGFGMLYSTNSAPIFLNAMIAADHGDASGLALLSIAARRQIAGQGHFGDMYSKGMVDFDPTRNYTNELQLERSIMGAPLSALLWGGIEDSTSWPGLGGAPVPPERVDVETLILSADLDVATPSMNATQQLLPILSRGQQVTVRHAGHSDIASSQGDGYARLVGGFFASGAIDTTGLRTAPVRFDRGPSLTRLAKLVVTGGVVVVGALAAGAVWLIRR